MIYTDISYYQNQPKEATYLPIDWQKMVDQGASGCYIKASQGLWPDRQFIRNFGESAGIIDRGPYHFFDPSKDPVSQANFFHGMIVEGSTRSKTNPELPPMLDLEWYAKLGAAMKPNLFKYLDQVTAFLDRMKVLGYEGYPRTLIYSNHSHITSYLPMPSATYSKPQYDKWANLGRHGLMVAQYSTDKALTLAGPNIPRPWIEYEGWQCSADGNGLGRAFGVHSPSIDLSRF